MKWEDVKTVGNIGAGTMGTQLHSICNERLPSTST